MNAFLVLLASFQAGLLHPQSGSREIVVTAQRVSDTEAALRACLERHCSVVDDINASLAHAENLLLHGDYRGARSVLRHSIGRNKDDARRYPEPVSELYRANALVASHLGFDRDYESSTYNIYRTLKSGIPVQDYRHLQAQMEIAAMTARMKGADRGERAYRDVARDARAIGRNDIAGMAEVRAAMLAYKQVPDVGKARVERIMRSASDPFNVGYARLFYANILRSEGKTDQADQLLREFGLTAEKPILLYSPAYEMVEQELGSVSKVPSGGADLVDGNVLRRPSRNFERMWVDVAFLVQPDGSVSDVEIVRSENDSFWAKPLLKAIQGRRYSRSKNQLPYPRLERYTYTAGYEALTGTRLAVRSPAARVEYLDLTVPETRKRN